MRYSLLALAATTLLSGAVSARGHAHRRHAHPGGHFPRAESSQPDECGCVTYVSSVLVPVGTAPAGDQSTVKQTMTVVPVVEPTTTTRSTKTSTATSTAVVLVTKSSSISAPVPTPPVPTPEVAVCSTIGACTIPAKTVTLTSTEVVCVPETTALPPGTHTVGGVTTIVQTATTVTCPYAAVETSNGVTTSKVLTTTYVCPTAGTYTIGATTTTVTGTVTVPCEYPVVTSYLPGTYTRPEIVTTVTVTSQVVTCPYTSSGLPTSAPAPSAPAQSPSAPAPSPSAPSASAPPAITSVPAVTSTPLAATSISSSAAPSSTSSPSKLTPGGGLWAITYSPYSDNGGCKTASDVEMDIADIASKGFQNIRLYSSDCNGLETVGSACEKHGVGIILGVFIKAGGVSTADDQVKAILAWKKWELVVLFVVGNEAVFNGYCSAAELAAYILRVKGELQGAGYTGQVTTAETLGVLEQNGAVLCGAMDVVGVNLHPFFNTQVTADKAGEFLAKQLKLAEGVCGGKQGWVLEAGWPSAGQPNGAAVPGVAEQKIAIETIVKENPGRVALFTYRNDLWKSGGAYNVEQSFGCANLF